MALTAVEPLAYNNGTGIGLTGPDSYKVGLRDKWRANKRGSFLIEPSTGESVAMVAGVSFYDDFIRGAGQGVAINDHGGTIVTGDVWTKKIVGAAPPTVAYSALSGGLVLCSLTSASQAQEASVTWNDQLLVDLGKKPIIEFGAGIKTLPSTATGTPTAWYGLGAAWATSGLPGSSGSWTDQYLLFSITYSSASVAQVKFLAKGSNTAAHDVAATASYPAVTIPVDTGFTCQIDCTDLTNILFKINNRTINVGTTVAWALDTTNFDNYLLQPTFGIAKASGTGVGAVYCDYVKYSQLRTA